MDHPPHDGLGRSVQPAHHEHLVRIHRGWLSAVSKVVRIRHPSGQRIVLQADQGDLRIDGRPRLPVGLGHGRDPVRDLREFPFHDVGGCSVDGAFPVRPVFQVRLPTMEFLDRAFCSVRLCSGGSMRRGSPYMSTRHRMRAGPLGSFRNVLTGPAILRS